MRRKAAPAARRRVPAAAGAPGAVPADVVAPDAVVAEPVIEDDELEAEVVAVAAGTVPPAAPVSRRPAAGAGAGRRKGRD